VHLVSSTAPEGHFHREAPWLGCTRAAAASGAEAMQRAGVKVNKAGGHFGAVFPIPGRGVGERKQGGRQGGTVNSLPSRGYAPLLQNMV